MADFPTFSRRMFLRADEVALGVNLTVQAAALAIDQALVLATPVDTGRARSNWLVSLGGPRAQEIGPYAPLPQGTDPEKFGERENAQAAINQGQSEIEKRKPDDFGVSIFISNNVQYIGLLNDGFSAQAPAKFVEQAVVVGARAVRGTRIFVSNR